MSTHRQHRAPRRSSAGAWLTTGRIAISAFLAVILFMVGLGGASAFFKSTGSDTASATTGTLNAPTAVTGTQVTGTSTVTVSWTAPTGTPAEGYYVQRTPSPSGVTVAACGTSFSTPITSTTCSDAGVPVGTYTYVVVALHKSWTATSAPSAVVTVVQTTQAITFTSTPVAPTVGGTYTVTATGGGSGNPVTFSSATPGVCTVAGSSVSFVHAGTCTINANQAGNAQYDPAPQVQQTFTVAKASQTISYTSTAPVNATVGGTGYTPTATGGASGNAVTFTIDATTATNCSISAGVVTYQHVGTCTVNANQLGNADYFAAPQVQQSYAIGKGAQAITFTSTAPANAKVNGATYNVTATATSGLAVTFTSNTPSICTVSGSTVSFIAAGLCTINANQAGNADYLAAGQVQQSFSVTKNDQTITFTSTAPANATYLGATYTPTATATSGLTVAFAIDPSSSGVCTINGSGVVSFNGVGTCTINATQAGNTVYNAAPLAQQSFSVGQAAQTITWNALPDKTFGAAPFPISPQATASSGLAITYTSATTSVCTVSGLTVTIVGGGLCTLNANQPGNSLYLAASQVQQSFTVNRATQTISFTQPTTPATATTTATLVFSASSGLPVTITPTDATVCSVSGTTVSYLKGGTCTLTASQAGNTNFAPAANVVNVVTVNKANQTITFNQPTTPANAGTSVTLASLGATASSGLAVTYTINGTSTSACAISGANLNYGATAGSCVINANQAGDAVYNAAAQVQRTVTVQVVDTTAPQVQVQYPGSISTTINNGTWTNNGCTTVSKAVGLCGTATDNVALAAGSAQYQLRSVTTGLCWSGSAFAAVCTTYQTAGGTAASWSIPIAYNAVPNGNYELRIRVVDAAGNANRPAGAPSGTPDVTFTK